MARDAKEIKKDRLLYTKNKFSANLIYLGILFGVLYFVKIYQQDVENYYYSIMIGFSVVCNLVFLLIAFLSSEGLKNYKLGYGVTVIVIGLVQIARIFGIPTMAHKATVMINEVETTVMSDGDYNYCVIMLLLSAAACIIAGVVGIYKSVTLNNYKNEKGLE